MVTSFVANRTQNCCGARAKRPKTFCSAGGGGEARGPFCALVSAAGNGINSDAMSERASEFLVFLGFGACCGIVTHVAPSSFVFNVVGSNKSPPCYLVR